MAMYLSSTASNGSYRTKKFAEFKMNSDRNQDEFKMDLPHLLLRMEALKWAEVVNGRMKFGQVCVRSVVLELILGKWNVAMGPREEFTTA